jgi:hypothetical protein
VNEEKCSINGLEFGFINRTRKPTSWVSCQHGDLHHNLTSENASMKALSITSLAINSVNGSGSNYMTVTNVFCVCRSIPR